MTETTQQFRLYNQMLIYFGKKFNLPDALQSIDDLRYVGAMEAQYTTRETLLKKDIKKEVTEYCKKNPDKLSEQELSIVGVWRNMKMVEGYLMQHKKDHSLLFDNINGVVYAINGISQPVKEMADNCDLPLQIATVLLPFENGLIRDGIITRSNIYYSGSIKNTLKNDMKSIIMTIGISQTLGDESQATETTKQEKSALQDVVYMMSDDPTYYKNSRLIDLVKKYPLCEAYYHTQGAKKEILEYRKKAKVLGISGYYVALFGNCISATGLSKTSTQEQAESIVPKEYHDKIEIKKIS